MSALERLKRATNLTDMAKILGFTPKGVSYILYKKDAAKKYRTFEIPKKSGGTRTIQAPEKHLSLLQGRLAILLYACIDERKRKNQKFWFASHGFHKGRTIVSNADVHRRRSFVFNIDLDDFFGAINFGRDRGLSSRQDVYRSAPSVASRHCADPPPQSRKRASTRKPKLPGNFQPDRQHPATYGSWRWRAIPFHLYAVPDTYVSRERKGLADRNCR